MTYVMVATNGARRGRGDHPKLPVTTSQIVQTASACRKAGADGLHLHVRDASGAHTLDSGRYREALAALHETVPGLDVQITTEAAGQFDVATQLACLSEVVPVWASIAVRETARSPDLAERLYALCAEQGTRVQHILYDTGDAALLAHWQAQGIVREGQDDRLLVLGRYTTGQVSTPADLDPVLSEAPPPAAWMVCAFGPQEHACLTHAAQQGSDVRVGFENALTDETGKPWRDNAASVAALIERLKGPKT